MSLTAVALCCSLKPSPSPSSSADLAGEVLTELARYGVSGEVLRLADYHITPGVSIDEGGEDQWPDIRSRILAADIVVVSTPIWMGHPASLAQVVMERLDAEISQTRPDGRPTMSGKVAAVAVVGNEDGAHHTSAQLFQGLSDVGFTIPAGGPTYWVGEAMGKIDYRDVSPRPESTAKTTRTLAANTAHLARLLGADPYPLGT
jgi:multimeric flavodoxin WrbA